MHLSMGRGCASSRGLKVVEFLPHPLILVFSLRYSCSFIKQYYELMAKNPSMLHRFYKAESFFTHCEGQQVGRFTYG